MRSQIIGAVAAAVVALPLAVAEAQDKRVFSMEEAAVGEFDPAHATDFADLILVSNIYDTLVWVGPGGKVIPHVAESWTSSDDGLVHTFKMRTDVKFHDGTPMTSEDVVFSLDRMVTLALGYSHLFRGWVKSAETADSHTVTFTLERPYAPFLAALVRLPIINKKLLLANIKDGDFGDLGDYGRAYLESNDAGSGAYTVISHNKQELTVMKRFDGYWLPFGPKSPDEARMRYSLEPATLRALMERGEHDVSSMWQPYETYSALDKVDGISAVGEPQTGAGYIKINTKLAPTDNVHIRRALAYATDYEALQDIIKIKEGLFAGAPARGPIPGGMMGYDKGLTPGSRDLAAAKKELELAGYDANTWPPVEVISHLCCFLHQKIALLVAANLAEIGVKAELTELTFPAFIERAGAIETSGNVQFVIHNAATPDIDPLLYELYHSSGKGLWSSTEWLLNDKVDAMLEAARGETNAAKREDLYKEVQRAIIAEQPNVFAFDSIAVYAKRDAVTLPFEDPAKLTGFIWADFNFRLTEVN